MKNFELNIVIPCGDPVEDSNRFFAIGFSTTVTALDQHCSVCQLVTLHRFINPEMVDTVQDELEAGVLELVKDCRVQFNGKIFLDVLADRLEELFERLDEDLVDCYVNGLDILQVMGPEEFLRFEDEHRQRQREDEQREWDLQVKEMIQATAMDNPIAGLALLS